MKQLLYIALIITFSFPLLGQTEKVKGELTTTDTVNLTIINIFPDSFPRVSVVFKAENYSNHSVWNLSKEQMIVKENSQPCKVISLEQISKNKAINLGIVIDHSESMQFDKHRLYDPYGKPLFTVDKEGYIIPPPHYKTPIQIAKKAVKSFISSFDTQKDYISVIGFSSRPDKILPLTQDTIMINSIIDSMEADSSTALYDAMLVGMDELKKADGIKVLVVLTDGMDNQSSSTYNDVIDKAQKENIPIYFIAIGDADTDILSKIAQETKGYLYFTASEILEYTYNHMSKKIQSFYNLVYESTNFSVNDSVRQIELLFDIDSVHLITSPESAHFPIEVMEYINKKEKEKEYLFYGGIALVSIIAAGSLLLYYQRKKGINVQPTINNLYPNPTNGIINIESETNEGLLQITNLNGQIVKTFDIQNSNNQFDLSDLQDGNYIAFIETNGQRSKGTKLILKR